MTHLELLTVHRDLLQGQKIPDSLTPVLKLTPTQILEDVINCWYYIHYKKLLHKKFHIKNGKLLKKITPKTNNPDEFWKIINPLLKKTISAS